MAKTQPLMTAPAASVQPAPAVKITPAPTAVPMAEETADEEIPMSLCWSLVAISAVTLAIQLWAYFS